MAITKEEFKAANARAAAAVSRGPIARAVRYDSRRGLIVITLEGGCEFSFPVALTEGLADAPRSKLAKIKISPNGLGLHWPLLDADLYVPGLIEGAFGSRRWMQQIGKIGGASRSSAKARASRENGKRGGRPKVEVAA
jgi:uncharacterized protein DUF2442